MSTLFENINDSEIKHPVILLIDASGSVRSDYVPGTAIIDKMEEIVQKINAQQFRFIFWNSDCPNEQNNINFPGGVIKLSHVVQKQSIKQPFFLAKSKISNSSLTFPHLGFINIPNEWIDNKQATHIYFFTDGQMGYSSCSSYEMNELKMKLKTAIEHLFKSHNNIHLHIVTVENKNLDFNQYETLSLAAGGDVFHVVQTNGLTKYITEFCSYTPNNSQGYRHIHTIIPPPGFVPFMDKCFSEIKTGEFITYLRNLIIKENSEDELLKIIQSLSATLRVLTKDKPLSVVNNIVNTFCDLFRNTAIDPTMVQFILADTIKLESQGKAIVFSQYRSKLKDLYKQAQDLLLQNTKNALGLIGNFITLPINDIIVTSHGQLITESLKFGKANYPNSGVKVNNIIIPAVPMRSELSPLNEQCLRQFIRLIIANQYKVDQLGDIVIYIVLGLVLRVVCSNVDEKYKDAFRNLGHVMLKKKRLNTDVTELQRLETGELPIANNGHIDQFYRHMSAVKNILGINCESMTLWYAICVALKNDNLIVKQLIHCKDSIKQDFNDIVPANILEKFQQLCKPVIVHEIPEERFLDYKCIITLEDCSSSGGYKILSHTTSNNSTCAPIYVISEGGYESLFNQAYTLCPVCYKQLTKESLVKVGPKLISNDIIFADNVDIFSSDSTPSHTQGDKKYNQDIKQSENVGQLKKKGILVLMRGTVGSGKTTYALRIKKAIEEMGGVCFNEGTDKYCLQGYSIQQACEMVKSELQKINSADNKLLVVVIDTCGERNNSDIIFDYNFTGWKKINVSPNYDQNKLKQYLAWTLRNVLRRQVPTTDSLYWLNPGTASVDTCVDVHYKKAKALFGSKIVKLSNSLNLETIINDINNDANDYDQYLTEKRNIDTQINKIIQKIKKSAY